MKGIAIFLAVAGIIAAVVGIYGFIMLNSSNYPAGTYDLVADMGTQMGLNSYLSPARPSICLSRAIGSYCWLQASRHWQSAFPCLC